MDDVVIFLLCNMVLFVFILLCIAIRNAFMALTDEFINWIYEKIKEKEMGEYIEHQFDNSRRKHAP